VNDTPNKFAPDQKVRVNYTDGRGVKTTLDGKIVRYETRLKLWWVAIGGVAMAVEEEDINADSAS
jgi:hypothetical protein